MVPWMRKPLQKCSKYGLTLIRQRHLFHEWQGHNFYNRSSIRCQTRTHTEVQQLLTPGMPVPVLGSMSGCSLISDGVIPQATHQRAKDRQRKLHLIPLAFWASQLSTPQCPLCFFLWLPCWLSLPLCLVLLPREKALCSCRKHRDISQQSANLQLQIPVSTERKLVSHYPAFEKKKLRGPIHLLVSYLWGHFVN